MQSQANSRLGFQYPKAEYKETLHDLNRWLDQVDDLPASWVLLEAGPERAIPEPFIKEILARGLEPIIHIHCQLGSLRAETINPLLYSYAHWGVKYVVVYDRPNLKASWSENQWTAANLVERFVDQMLPILQASHSAGLVPILPPLEPGGDYWDTAFLKSALKALARRGQKDLIDSLMLSAYAWTQDKDLSWGQGGPTSWPQARPYYTPEDCQDQRGFNIFEWYRAIAAEVFGVARPVLALSGGANRQAAEAKTINSTIARNLQHPDQYPGLQTLIFHSPPGPDDRAEWKVEKPEAASKAAPNSPTSAPEIAKRLAHYLLLPEDEELAIPIWRRATAFALTHQPVIGFSIEEAFLAQRVTIAADLKTIPAEVETKLQAAGCQVQRLSLLPKRKSQCERPTA